MRSSKTYYLPEHVGFYSTNSSESLVIDLSQNIYEIINEAIKKRGRASMAVSGGSTPKPLFEELSLLDLDWSKVDLTLVDDRWVDADHKDSNELLVRTHFIKNKAERVNFLPLKNDEQTAKQGISLSEEGLQSFTMPFDVIILGMGEDGHTASLFPCSDELKEGMDLKTKNTLVSTNPKSAPYERISLTAKSIMEAKKVFLHLNGSSKLHTIEEAMNLSDSNKMPIYAFLDHGLDIFWSP
jgi:6-phosphogluconolactonase